MTRVYCFKSMLPGVQILPMRESDFEAARAMYAQVHALHTENRPDIYVQTDFFDRAFFDELLFPASGATLAAEADGHAVGCACSNGKMLRLFPCSNRVHLLLSTICA